MTEQIVGKCSKCVGNVYIYVGGTDKIYIPISSEKREYDTREYLEKIENIGFIERIFNFPKRPERSSFYIKQKYLIKCDLCNTTKELPTIEME